MDDRPLAPRLGLPAKVNQREAIPASVIRADANAPVGESRSCERFNRVALIVPELYADCGFEVDVFGSLREKSAQERKAILVAVESEFRLVAPHIYGKLSLVMARDVWQIR